MDPIAEKFPHVSVFNYAENEPVGHIDLWGLQKWDVNGKEVNGPYRNQEEASKTISNYWLSGGNVLPQVTVFSNKNSIAKMSIEFVDESNDDVSLWESLIPIWGSAKMAKQDFRNNNYGWGVFNIAMAISDVFLAKTLVAGGIKLGNKTFFKSGSNSWRATRAWMGKNGMAKKGQEVHHFLIQRNGFMGKHVPNIIKNQPWNLVPMPKNPLIHQALHGKGSLKNYQIPLLILYSPDWMKASGGILGRGYQYNKRGFLYE